MRHSLIVVLLLALCIGCGNSQVVVVSVDKLPTAAVELEVLASLDGQVAGQRPRLALDATQEKPSHSFFFRLPAPAAGLLNIAVAARDPRGCIIALAEKTQPLLAQDEQKVQLSITPLPAYAVDRACNRVLPQILAVSPERATNDGLDGDGAPVTLTITGWGFHPAAQLRIGAAPATDLHWESFMSLRARLPAQPGRLGKAPVEVLNPDGSISRLESGFRYAAKRLWFVAQPIIGLPAGYQVIESVTGVDGNGDSFPDLFATYWTGVPVSETVVGVLLNNGNGTFGAMTRYGRSGGSSHLVAVGNVDGDGRPDIVVPDQGMSYFRNRGGGLFDSQPIALSFETGLFSCGLMRDYNNDGLIDCIGDNSPTKNKYQLHVNVGSGRFKQAGLIDGQVTGIGDINGDGWLDLYVFKEETATLSIHINQRNGDFLEKIVLDASMKYQLPFLAEWKGDGLVDAIFATNNLERVTILRNQGNDQFAQSRLLVYGLEQGDYIAGVGDLDGDELPDFVSSAAGTGISGILVNPGRTGTFMKKDKSYLLNSNTFRIRAIVDIDQDGRNDIILTDAYFGQGILILLNNSY